MLTESLRRAYRTDAAERHWLLALVAAAFALRLGFAALPTSTLITHVTPDDAYYYLQIGRNVANGRGVTFDGAGTTNGFHPLWMLLVSACYALPVPDEASLRLALGASALVAALACVPLWALVRALTDSRGAAIAAAAAYGLNPVLAAMSVNGLETGLALAAFLLCTERFLAFLRSPRRFETLTFGLAGGVMVLARTDAALILFAMLLVAAATRADRRATVVAGAVAALVTAPWFAWMALSTQTLVQSSGEAVPIVAHGNGPHGLDAVTHGLRLLGETWWTQIPRFYFVPPPLEPAAVMALALVAAGVTIAAIRRRLEAGAAPLLAALALGVIALTVAHAGVRWYFRDWYLPAIVPATIIAIAACWSPLQASALRGAAGAAIVGLVAASYVAMGVHDWGEPRYAIQRDIYDGARWIDGNTPPDAVVGSLNAGIVGYFSERRTVDLDGVVDSRALDAVRDKRLAAYAGERCVTHIAEYPFYIFWYGEYWGDDIVGRLEAAQRFDAATRHQPTAIASDFTVWRYAATQQQGCR